MTEPEQQEERVPYEPPKDAEHWPATNAQYLMWAYERACAIEGELTATTESLRKRAVITVASYWAIVGWLLTSSLGPRLLGLPICGKLALLLPMVAAGVLMLMVVIPRTLQGRTILALISQDALAHKLAGTLLSAVEQVDRVYQENRVLTNRRGTWTAWTQVVSAGGVLLALILSVL
jgi:hypothetical protein